MTEYSLWQKIRIAWSGKISIEKRLLPHWNQEKDPIMFYAFNCPIHGIVENYPAGYSKRLICPKCINSKDEQ